MGKSVITGVEVVPANSFESPDVSLLERFGPTLMLVEGVDRGDGAARWRLAHHEREIIETPSNCLMFDLEGVGSSTQSLTGPVADKRRAIYEAFERRYPLEEPAFRRVHLHSSHHYNYASYPVNEVVIDSVEEARRLRQEDLIRVCNSHETTHWLPTLVRLARQYKRIRMNWDFGTRLRNHLLHELANEDVVIREENTVLLYDPAGAKRTRACITGAEKAQAKRAKERARVKKLQEAEAKEARRIAKKAAKDKPPPALEGWEVGRPAANMLRHLRDTVGINVEQVLTSDYCPSNIVRMWRFGLSWMNLVYGSNAHREIPEVWRFIKNVWPVYGESTKKGWRKPPYGLPELFAFFDAESKCRRNGRVRPLADRLAAQLEHLPEELREH